jgi:hypothetical protein
LKNLRDHLADLRHRHDDAGRRITAALLAGEDTGSIRADAATLSRDIAALEQRIADADAERAAEAQRAISAAAAALAADAEDTINTTLARLAAPEHP